MKNYVKPDLFIDNLFADKNVSVDPYMPVDPDKGGSISGVKFDDLWSMFD